MDVDAISTSRPCYSLSDAERDRCMRENRCFRCKQQGHLSLSCPSQSTPLRAHVNAITAPSIPATSPPLVTNVIRDVLSLSSAERQQVINSLLLADCDLDPGTPIAQINALALPFPLCFSSPTPSRPPSPIPHSASPIRTPAHVALLGLTPIDETPHSPLISPPHPPSPVLPPPHPPHNPLRPSSPCVALPSVVADDNLLNGGVTIDNSVSTPETII
ncbi:hypothetical protein EDB92DRAFT_1948282 [Lactarius akahatsu]|uniref:CCHC-type domain-containing protein n=1 Tax=Lactarius akahatsu TaxID=416441 RepID=A0AAD4LDU9_9AGAM|nr:hypothetical protein EDB92DRAFT_1948282 [Lactarius akahatsu]